MRIKNLIALPVALLLVVCFYVFEYLNPRVAIKTLRQLLEEEHVISISMR
jgi:hypothetical protein